MKFELPKLPYEADALAPVISAETIGFHYGKHHLTYVNNLNNLLVGSKFENETLLTIVTLSDGAIFNNAAQIWNHTFYFESFAKEGTGGQPGAELTKAIVAKWESIDNFKKEFVAAGASLFGSGWVWLAKNKEGKLEILKESNAGNPITIGYKPILTFDVWEHAYYLDYRNRRVDHLNDLWRIVNWNVVSKRF